jgi:hypothetical protein
MFMRAIFRLCALPFRLVGRLTSFIAFLALIASLVFNVAMLTVSGVYVAASAALSGLGVTTVVAREAGEKLAQRKVALKIGQETAEKVTRRVQRGAARNITSVVGEAIPFVGIAILASALALEVQDACDTAADMAGLAAALAAEGDAETARQAAIDSFDCKAMIREQIPDYETLPTREEIWARVKASPDAARDISVRYYDTLRSVDWAAEYRRSKSATNDWIQDMFSWDDWKRWWNEEDTRP